MRTSEERGPWYLLTGLVLGFTVGLVFAWLIAPVRYVNAAPQSLRADFKDQYRTMIAAAYQANRDLARARARLALLGDEDPARALTMQAQQALAAGRPESEAVALGLLAVAIAQQATPLSPTAPPLSTPSPTAGQPTITPPSPTLELTLTPSPVFTPTSPANTPSPTLTPRTPLPTFTPLPTRTPTPTPGAPFALQDMKLLCDPRLQQPLIIVETYDAAGQGVPGVEILVTWQGGEDHFFTGLKPELGLAYADFAMTPGVSYTLRLAEGGQPLPDISAQECEAAGQRFWGAWRLVFAQP